MNERFRFYRYDLGQTFRWHRDGYFERPNRERSRLTLMVYVNDDFEGGHTRFEEALIKPVKGTASSSFTTCSTKAPEVSADASTSCART